MLVGNGYKFQKQYLNTKGTNNENLCYKFPR